MDVGSHVRRIFAIQEERQAQYAKLKKVQEQYVSQQQGGEWYRRGVAEVTGRFQALSQEVMVCIGELRGRGLRVVAAILESIQEQEKEKLQLTVKWHKENCEELGEGEEEEEEDDFGMSEHQKRELRKQLARVEGAIAELMQELRYECEPFLLQEQDSEHTTNSNN